MAGEQGVAVAKGTGSAAIETVCEQCLVVVVNPDRMRVSLCISGLVVAFVNCSGPEADWHEHQSCATGESEIEHNGSAPEAREEVNPRCFCAS